MKLDYFMKTAEGTVNEGSVSFTGALHVIFPVHNETIEEIRADVKVDVADEEKIFMNGYQTWTTCPEYSRDDRIRGLHGIPRPLVRRYAFDGYSDYHFTDYPYTKGILHGFSWCYFRRGGFYRLFASLSEKNGYTQFLYNDEEGILHITKDCKGLKADGDFEALDLYYAEGSEAEVFDTWFAMPGIIEARYHNGTDRLIIRKTCRDTERLSGDYNTYPAAFEHPAGSFILQCRGTEDSVNTAEFRVIGGCASIVMNSGEPGRGLSPEELDALAAQFI